MNELSELLKSGTIHKIIVMVGAGISVASGIPDFRSPETGVYASIAKDARMRKKSSTFVFEMSTFLEDPRPFWWMFGKMIPDISKAQPTDFHFFIELLHRHGLLLRCYTQNIDGLETAAGLPNEMIIHAHGVENQCHCINCHHEIPISYCLDAIQLNLSDLSKPLEQIVVPICPKCGGNHVKPDVVLFEEDLPDAFYDNYPKDFQEADLLIIAGTSLKVYPFANLPRKVQNNVKRFIINNVPVKWEHRFHYGSGRDFFLEGDCQNIIKELVEKLGWKNELEQIKSSATTLGEHWKHVGKQ